MGSSRELHQDLCADAQERSPVCKAALLSPCGSYRYWLSREWSAAAPKLAFVMLNPSTADAEVDDPTIRRCIGFARREGFGGIVVCNLFALRSTDPAVLKTARDPIGPDNDRWLDELMHRCPTVIAAWGTHGKLRERGARIKRRFAEAGKSLYCLGTSKDGHPKHPLYIAADQPLVAYVAARDMGSRAPQGADDASGRQLNPSSLPSKETGDG